MGSDAEGTNIRGTMKQRAEDKTSIEGQGLSSWAVMPGGTNIRLDLVMVNGKACSVVLPFDALSSLLVTLPRMLQAALDARCPDGSLRVTQQLASWQIERARDNTSLILKLTTPDGFEVAFALTGKEAGSLGVALITTSRLAEESPSPRLH
jgi:hypothetical protein